MGVRTYVCRYVLFRPALSLSRITTVAQSIKSSVWKGLDTRHPSSTCMHAIRISREMLYVAIVNLEKLTFNSGLFSAG